MAEKKWDSEAAVVKLAKKLHRTAVRVRGHYELKMIPQDHPYSPRAGQEYSTPLEITHVGSDGKESIYLAGVDEDGRYMGTAQQWQDLRDELAWLKDIGTDEIRPDPDGVDPAVDKMEATAKSIWDFKMERLTSSADITLADAPITNWQSTAGLTFRKEFWAHFEDTLQNQAHMANAMSHTMDGYRELLTEHRISLSKVLTNANSAIETIETGGSASFSTALTAIAALATIAAGVATIPVTGGGSLSVGSAAAFTIIAGSSSLGAMKGESKPPTKVDLGADTVSGVLVNLVDSIAKNAEDFAEGEEEVAGKLDEYVVKMKSPGKPAMRYILPEPGVVDGSADLPYDGEPGRGR